MSLTCALYQEREEAEEFDDKKLGFYLKLILSTIAAHCSEGEDQLTITASHIISQSRELMVEREADANCEAIVQYGVNFTRVANELRVACGARSELHTGDGGQVVNDVLARMGIPAGLFKPLKRVHGVRNQRRGARTLIMKNGRKELAPRHVTRKDAKAELAKLVESGELDVGRKFPSRLFVELEREGTG